jgi:hypothetical protein
MRVWILIDVDDNSPDFTPDVKRKGKLTIIGHFLHSFKPVKMEPKKAVVIKKDKSRVKYNFNEHAEAEFIEKVEAKE